MADDYGGGWTLIKLDKVQRYLQSYVTAMKKRKYQTHYLDAFAGTGYVDFPEKQTTQPSLFDFEDIPEQPAKSPPLIDGSAARSLRVAPPFQRYHFIEKDRDRANRLHLLQDTFPDLAKRIEIIRGDANTELRRICHSWPHGHKGVIFLDPYGMEVEWDTLKAIARTGSLDVWYLVTTGIVRMLPRSGTPEREWRDKLRRTYGQDGIDDIFYPRKQTLTLWSDEPVEVIERQVDWSRVRDFFLSRLRSIFPAVAPNPLWLYNATGSPLFLLCFAVSSPHPSAQSLALRIANYILEMK